jgi:hypothetical protein
MTVTPSCSALPAASDQRAARDLARGSGAATLPFAHIGTVIICVDVPSSADNHGINSDTASPHGSARR